jgi:predicted metalloprotease with PDZ domain
MVHGLAGVAEAARPNLEYVMTANATDVAAHQAHVSIAVNDLGSSPLRLMMHAYHGRYPIPILNFTSSSPKGQVLPSKEYYRDKDRYWTIQTQGLRNLRVEYDVVFGAIRGNYDQHLGFLGNDFGMSMAEWVFLVPCDISSSNIKVEFQLPAGWRAFAPWRREGQAFYPSSFEYLATSTFALGNFDSFSEAIGRTDVSIAVYSGWSASSQRKLVETAFRIFEYQTALFGESVGEEYLAVFSPLADDGKWIWGGEYSQSQGLSVQSSPDDAHHFIPAMQQFSHQLFHRWNAWEPYGMRMNGDEEQWFSEGVDVYYESKTLVDLGIMREYSDLRNLYSEYLSSYFNTSKDMPLVMAGKYHNPEQETSTEFIIYRKGALTCLLLDVNLLKATNGERDLGLLLRRLYELHGQRKASYSNGGILKELNRLADYSFADFFKRYVYGVERLPLDELFTRLGLSTSREVLKVGDDLELAARLTEYQGRPISNETVRFCVDLAPIAIAVTDSRGEARAVYVVNRAGTVEVEAWYSGAADYTRLPSSESLSLTVESAEAQITIQTSVTEIATTPVAVVARWLDLALPYLALAAVLLAMVLILPRFRKKS